MSACPGDTVWLAAILAALIGVAFGLLMATLADHL